jgi:hypothetical protein
LSRRCRLLLTGRCSLTLCCRSRSFRCRSRPLPGRGRPLRRSRRFQFGSENLMRRDIQRQNANRRQEKMTLHDCSPTTHSCPNIVGNINQTFLRMYMHPGSPLNFFVCPVAKMAHKRSEQNGIACTAGGTRDITTDTAMYREWFGELVIARLRRHFGAS